jgi:hypothetical protein
MTARPVAKTSRNSADGIIERIATNGRILDLTIDQRPWFIAVAPGQVLTAGEPAPSSITIPQDAADRLLKGFVRFKENVPEADKGNIVWTKGKSELLVRIDTVQLECASGLVIVSIVVACNEIAEPRKVSVPFAVGTRASPRGLLMSTFNRVDAPPEIAEAWSDPIIAFCWESVLDLAQHVSAQAGNDKGGQPLIPGLVAAEKSELIIQPMARHDLSGLTG